MAQAKTVAQYNKFVAGLITEATELTFPENSSYDEDNCVLYTKGNRKRRLGVDFEDDFNLSSFSVTSTQLETFAINTYTWLAVSGLGNTNFLVVQLGNTLYFFDHSSTSLSLGVKSFTVDLDSYLAPTAVTSSANKVSCATGKGDLFVVSKSIEPLHIVYNQGTDTLTVSKIDIKIRDLKGLSDGLEVDKETATDIPEHKYNLLNQGWCPTLSGYDPLLDYKTATSNYPPNSIQWFTAKETDGTCDIAELRKIPTGTSKAPRGHYIVNPFYIDRSTISGVTGLAVESTNDRPVATSFFAGRMCYGLNSDIYISQVLTLDRDNVGKCYQDSDPTAEDISDLVDSDGLVISIPDLGSILDLQVVGANLVVFGNNGVWYISSSGGFKATDFAVTKLTSIGVLSTSSVTQVEDVTVWLGETSIMSIQLDKVTGYPTAVSLTDDTIKTFYTGISTLSKANAQGQYDTATKTLQWLYKDEDTAPTGSSPYFYNKVLTLDLRLGAFYPYTISSLSGGKRTPFLASVFRTPSLNQGGQSFNVTEIDQDQIVTTGGGIVVADLDVTVGLSTFIKYLMIVPDKTTSNNYITFGLFSNLSFTDWEKYDIINYEGDGENYDSYVETGFDLQGDMVRQKQAPYIITHCRRTENEYTNDSGDVVFLTPSGLKLQARWDWNDTGSGSKWSSNQEVYRLRQQTIDNIGDVYDPGNKLVTSRSKIRGRGRALQLRFSSERGKDFDLLGWGIVYTGTTDV